MHCKKYTDICRKNFALAKCKKMLYFYQKMVYCMAADVICNTHPQASISVTGVSVVNLMLKLETVCRGVVSSSNLMMQKVDPQALAKIVESQASINTVIRLFYLNNQKGAMRGNKL
jgi:hypothetical protein